MGLVFKSDVFLLFNPANSKDVYASKEELLQGLSEPVCLVENSGFKTQNNTNSQYLDENATLEKEMIEMMDLIKNQPQGNIQNKLESLLELVGKKLKSSNEAASNMQLRVLYQFLLEYKKAKEFSKKSLESKNSKNKPNQRKKVTQAKPTKIVKNSSKTSLKSETNSQ